MKKKIRLLFVVEEVMTNGAMISMLSLLDALPEEKYDISLFVFEHSGNLMGRIPSKVNILPEKIAYSVHRLPAIPAIRKALRHKRIDLVLYRLLLSFQRRMQWSYHFWIWLPLIEGDYDVVCTYADGFVAPAILRKVKTGRKCCWVHFPYTKAPLMPYEYDALKKADACAIVSKTVGDDLDIVLGKCDVAKFVVHNIVDAEVCIRKAAEPCPFIKKEGVYRLVSVGRITPAKGFDIVSVVAEELIRRKILFEWYVIGDGEDLEKFRLEVKSKKLDFCVHFVGNMPNPLSMVKSADVVVQPSKFESWGMTISEALCLGKAIVASNLAVFEEQIQNGYNGILRPTVPSIMAEAIESLLVNGSSRHRLEANAINYPFTKEHILEEFNAMITYVLDKR